MLELAYSLQIIVGKKGNSAETDAINMCWYLRLQWRLCIQNLWVISIRRLGVPLNCTKISEAKASHSNWYLAILTLAKNGVYSFWTRFNCQSLASYLPKSSFSIVQILWSQNFTGSRCNLQIMGQHTLELLQDSKKKRREAEQYTIKEKYGHGHRQPEKSAKWQSIKHFIKTENCHCWSKVV